LKTRAFHDTIRAMQTVKKPIGKIARRVLVIFIALAALIGTSPIWLPGPGEFLAVKDEVKKADCIIVLQGDPYRRFLKTAELVQRGLAKKIIVSPEAEAQWMLSEIREGGLTRITVRPVGSEEYTAKALEHFGISADRVTFTNRKVTSTYDEAVATKEIVEREGYTSCILVTGTYHMRRALMIFASVFGKTKVKIYHAAAENVDLAPSRWWAKERDVKEVLLEYVSIAYNYVYHFVLKKDHTSFDT